MKDVTGPDFPAEIAERALALGADLVQALKRGTKTRIVDKQLQACSERMEALVQYRREAWPYEYQFWQGKKKS